MTDISQFRQRGVRHVPAGQGPTLWIAEDTASPEGKGMKKATYTIKSDSESSNGSLAFVEAEIPPGSGPPEHTHSHADEAYYILSGSLEVRGNRVFEAKAGDFVFIPRGEIHTFRNVGTVTAKMLFLFTPAGFEGLFAEIGDEAIAGQPAPITDEDDYEKARDIAPKYVG